MTEWMAALAGAAGSALVGAMATDGWHGARTGFARLIGRGDRRRRDLVEARLDDDASAVLRAGDGDRELVRRNLLPAWRARLVEFLQESPEARSDLEVLVWRLRGQAAAAGPARIQINNSRDGGTTYAVQGGVQNVHHSGPGVTPPAAHPDGRDVLRDRRPT